MTDGCFTRTPASSLLGREQLHCHADQLGQILGVELLLELGAGVDHGLVADVELLGDAAIGLAFRQQGQRLQFARGEVGERTCPHARAHQSDLHGEIIAEIGRARAHLVKRLHQLVRVLEHVAARAGLESTRGDDRIAVHTEHENARARIVRPHAPDYVEAPKSASLHGEVDDYYVGMMAAVEAIAGGRVASFEHGVNSRILQHAAASLQYDRMIVDDQDASHHLLSCSGIMMRTEVPRPVALSTLQLPSRACTRSFMPRRPKPGAAAGSIPRPSSRTVSASCDVLFALAFGSLMASPSSMATCFACACRMTLVRLSCR